MPTALRRARQTLMMVFACAVVLVGASVAQGSAKPGLVPYQGGQPVLRPSTIVLSGDGSYIIGGRSHRRVTRGNLGHIRWRSYTRRQARGIAAVWFNDCRPICARGRFHKHNATVRAWRVRRGHYTRLVVRYRWGGHWRSDRRHLHRVSGDYYWQ